MSESQTFALCVAEAKKRTLLFCVALSSSLYLQTTQLRLCNYSTSTARIKIKCASAPGD